MIQYNSLTIQTVPNSCFFGVIDTTGFPEDSYYFYSSQWGENKTTLHIVPQSWNEEDLTISNGNPSTTEIFSSQVF
ncbi:hypothetical protein [Lachnoclostridium sp. An181]|uniref:hypothetical protein n=1 Tax=Lachnoclostridium sp. An181 TaxID=1965575 RepID=UPI000B377C3E|nr:hypothetical protein [Lachnoclostridium sp. An181]OUP48618.1 hypothetical protein B5F18_11490 [Lachnoclostridium sp. An181]